LRQVGQNETKWRSQRDSFSCPAHIACVARNVVAVWNQLLLKLLLYWSVSHFSHGQRPVEGDTGILDGKL
jgi:hypothetical protein